MNNILAILVDLCGLFLSCAVLRSSQFWRYRSNSYSILRGDEFNQI